MPGSHCGSIARSRAVEARGLDQLGRDDPAAGFFDRLAHGVPVEADAARAEVPLVVVALQPTLPSSPASIDRWICS
jgi:hypothetical protein